MNTKMASAWIDVAERAFGRRPRVSTTQEGQGQMGFPEIVVYRITKGARQGDALAYPPSIVHATSEPYAIEVQHFAAYDALARAGFWDSEEHRGVRLEITDRRATS